MFFSIIIPTYNPRKYLPVLLTSIATNDCIDDIEVIISDDCSTEKFDDIVKQFNQLNIRIIVNDKHYGFPRTGRQNGANAAQGKWICFSDQDDYFIEHSLDEVKNFIVDNDVKNGLYTNFIEESVETGEQVIREGNRGWTHGKFYEKEFWDKYDIKYEDVDYCEDIALSTKIECLSFAKNVPICVYKKNTYVWRRRGDSLADERYFINSMPDYIKATSGTIIKYVEQYKDNKELFLAFNVKFINTILNVFFNFQSSILKDQKIALRKAMEALQPYYTQFKKITNFTNADIIYYINTELVDLYNNARAENYSQIPFVEQMSFQDWLWAYLE